MERKVERLQKKEPEFFQNLYDFVLLSIEEGREVAQPPSSKDLAASAREIFQRDDISRNLIRRIRRKVAQNEGKTGGF